MLGEAVLPAYDEVMRSGAAYSLGLLLVVPDNQITQAGKRVVVVGAAAAAADVNIGPAEDNVRPVNAVNGIHVEADIGLQEGQRSAAAACRDFCIGVSLRACKGGAILCNPRDRLGIYIALQRGIGGLPRGGLCIDVALERRVSSSASRGFRAYAGLQSIVRGQSRIVLIGNRGFQGGHARSECSDLCRSAYWNAYQGVCGKVHALNCLPCRTTTNLRWNLNVLSVGRLCRQRQCCCHQIWPDPMHVHSDPRRVNATEQVAEQPRRYLAEWYRGTERTGPAGLQRKRKRKAFTLLNAGRKPYSCACGPAMIQTAGVVRKWKIGSVPGLAFEDCRDPHPAGCADRDQPPARAAVGELLREPGDDARAGGAERMADRDAA